MFPLELKDTALIPFPSAAAPHANAETSPTFHRHVVTALTPCVEVVFACSYVALKAKEQQAEVHHKRFECHFYCSASLHSHKGASLGNQR